MRQQAHINEKMRAILIDWLVEVHLKFRLKTETLYLTFNLIDRFLERVQVSRSKLQLVGVTCLLLASKYEEIYPPDLRDFVYVTDKAYTKKQILQMEGKMLKELNFKQIECFTIGSDGVIDKAAATSAALKVSLLVGSLRNDPRFGFRWRGPPPKLLLKIVSVGFALTALVPSALSAVDPYAAREVGSG